MKKAKVISIVLFCAIILVPFIFFNWEEDYVSEIDNKVLTNFPNAENTSGDLTTDIENYVNDRIGGRENFINAYTVLNDKVFDVMVHPSYTYGQDGYVFFKMGWNIEYGEYQEAFVNMVSVINEYYEEQETEFYFCFDPAKITVYSQYLPEGVNYDSTWVDTLIEELETRGVKCINNTDILIEKSSTELVYNKQYDAGHWNDLGAFYGTNHLFSVIHEDFEAVHELEKEDFEITSYVATSLPVSHFEINDEVPAFDWKGEVEDLTAEYIEDVELDPTYNHFCYLKNNAAGAEELPKMLIFQGSYLNGREKFIVGNTSEYIAVHNYHNILNYEYYYEKFQPDCVVFEVAEYVFNNEYFDYESMKVMK